MLRQTAGSSSNSTVFEAEVSEAIVDIKQLTIRFGEHEVLRDFDLRIDPGEIVSVVGESGSGKSVGALMSMGLLDKNAEIYAEHALLFGRPILQRTPQHWLTERGTKVSMIFQDPMTALHPSMRVGKQLDEVLTQHTDLSTAERTKRILQAFTEVDLPEPEVSAQKYPHELSGGQRQRVVIAMAMLLEPELIIADEPTTALDKAVEAKVLELLSKLVREKKCALWFISHDLEVVSAFSDRVLVLFRGQLVEEGPAKQLFNAPQHPYTQGLLACRPPQNGRPYPLPVLEDFLSGSGATKQVELAAPTGSPNILSVQGLNIGFEMKKGLRSSTKWVVRDLDLELHQGETLGLIGPSGSGKSSIGRAIVGLNKATYSALDAHVDPGKIQFIFQDPFSALNPSQRIGTVLDRVLKKHQGDLDAAQRAKRAAKLMEEVGLKAADLKKRPAAFSGGQRQRIGIARALATNPALLICDESVSALDVSVQAQVLNLLNGIKKNRDLSMIFISHDPDVISYMCDRTMHLEPLEA